MKYTIKQLKAWVNSQQSQLRRGGGIALPMSQKKEFIEVFGVGNARKTLAECTEEYVAIAEKLAKEHAGMLPHGGWLERNGFKALALFMWRHPDGFAHIAQDKGRKTAKEWVVFAEDLAKDSRGSLPYVGWLMAHKYFCLVQQLYLHPEAFAHIPQNKKRKTTREWLAIAENLAKHRGVLPSCGWMRRNGFNSLDACIKRHPEAFAHIKRNRERRPR